MEAVYPLYPDAGESGYALAVNLANYSAGSHTVTVKVTDNDGATKEKSATITTQRFSADWITSDEISIDGASCSGSGSGIECGSVSVEGSSYDIELTWDVGMQAFAITSIDSGALVGEDSYNKQQTERLLGKWSIVYTILSQWQESYEFFTTFESTTASGVWVAGGYDSYGNADVVAYYDPDYKTFAMLDLGTLIDQFYMFDFTGANSIVGLYHQLYSDGTMSSGYAMSGTRSASKAAALAFSADTSDGYAREIEQVSEASQVDALRMGVRTADPAHHEVRDIVDKMREFLKQN